MKKMFLMASVALMVASCGDNKKPEESTQTTEQGAVSQDTPAASQDTEAVNVAFQYQGNQSQGWTNHQCHS